MPDSGKNVVRILLDILYAHGVKEIVCSPGSRNAPLLIGADARPQLRKRIVTDERSAAFVALGISQISREPVALICTSGTALLNYAPAVAEAYYQGLPLIVISADRPMEWIDQDDSQTIKQPYALKNFVKGSYSISDREQNDTPGWYETRIANDAMITALAPKQGPVHINVSLSPPLDILSQSDFSESPRVIRRIPSAMLPEKNIIKELAHDLCDKRVLIVAGSHKADSRLNRSVLRFRQHENVVVMAETISNLHLPEEDYAIDSVLCNLDDKTRNLLVPDIVISVGGALISRMLKEYLRQCSKLNRNLTHWNIGYNHTTTDCFQALTLRIDTDPARMLGALTAELAHLKRIGVSSVTTGFANSWNSLRKHAIHRIDRNLNELEWSDAKAFYHILKELPSKCNLILSNGTSIRYAQIFTRRLPHAEYCNRGVSGIDGSTSTSIGCAIAYKGSTVLITGDSSFAYDISALQTMHMLGIVLKIVVINNGGGGIFRFIKSTSSLDCREEYFCADPNMPIKGIADAYGYSYHFADSIDSLKKELMLFLNEKDTAILEIKTPPEKSAKILKTLLFTD